MQHKKGKVIFAGAGPGDAELITVKLQRKFAEAEVILTDRLVNPEIIELFANKNATIILCGKQGYNAASVPQNEISDLIVQYALQGKTVLRLKGGDVAFFSNVLDELTAIQQNNITFEIIPGITAASGTSAYTGIPLTAKGFAQGVSFLMYNPNSSYTSAEWAHYANCKDTLVFYMASRNITQLAAMLLRYTKNPHTPLALVVQATTPHQKIHITTLEKCEDDFKDQQFSSPSLVIIGEVVHLYERFNWLHITAEAQAGAVFKELAYI